jgi:hypothetical protein
MNFSPGDGDYYELQGDEPYAGDYLPEESCGSAQTFIHPPSPGQSVSPYVMCAYIHRCREYMYNITLCYCLAHMSVMCVLRLVSVPDMFVRCKGFAPLPTAGPAVVSLKCQPKL